MKERKISRDGKIQCPKHDASILMAKCLLCTDNSTPAFGSIWCNYKEKSS